MDPCCNPQIFVFFWLAPFGWVEPLDHQFQFLCLVKGCSPVQTMLPREQHPSKQSRAWRNLPQQNVSSSFWTMMATIFFTKKKTSEVLRSLWQGQKDAKSTLEKCEDVRRYCRWTAIMYISIYSIQYLTGTYIVCIVTEQPLRLQDFTNQQFHHWSTPLDGSRAPPQSSEPPGIDRRRSGRSK